MRSPCIVSATPTMTTTTTPTPCRTKPKRCRLMLRAVTTATDRGRGRGICQRGYAKGEDEMQHKKLVWSSRNPYHETLSNREGEGKGPQSGDKTAPRTLNRRETFCAKCSEEREGGPRAANYNWAGRGRGVGGSLLPPIPFLG